MKNLKALTLVELMIAVSILALGMTVALRSFLISASALESSQNKISASLLLATKMEGYQERAKTEGTLKEESVQEEATLGSRAAQFTANVRKISPVAEKTAVNEVTLALMWSEESKPQNSTLVGYVETTQE